jgi:hypothetical protein
MSIADISLPECFFGCRDTRYGITIYEAAELLLPTLYMLNISAVAAACWQNSHGFPLRLPLVTVNSEYGATPAATLPIA